MRRVRFFYDEPREVSEELYLHIIERVGEAMYSGVLMLAAEVGRGIPDVREVATPEMLESLTALTRGVDEISDQQLRSYFRSLADYTSQLWELEQELIEMIASYYHLATPLSNAERRRLHKKLGRHYVLPPTSDWRSSQRYQEMRNQAEEIHQLLPSLKEQLDDRLAELRAQLNTRS